MTPVTKEAIDAIGLSADKVTADITSGAKTYFEVIQEISKRTREETDPRKIGAIFADVFKGAGEDAGDFVLELDKIGKEYDDLEGEALGYYNVQQDLIQAQENFEIASVSFFSKFKIGWATIKTGILEAAAAAIRFFGSHEDKKAFAFESTLNEWSKKTLPEVVVELRKVGAEIRDQEDTMKKYSGTVLKDAQKELELMQEEYNALNKILKDAHEAQIKTEEVTTKTTEAIQGQAKAVRNVSLEFSGMSDDLDDLYRKMTDLDEALIQRIIFGDPKTTEEEFKEKEDKILEDVDRVNERIKEKHRQQREELLQAEEDAEGERIEKAFISFEAASTLTNTLTGLKLANLQREFEAAEGNELKQRQIMREMARIEKRQAVFNAIINTAAGITKAIPNIPLMALAAAVGAFQIGVIASQPLPKFKKGGLIGGKPHEQGGTVIEAEYGEMIQRKEAVKAYPELLKRANNLQLDKNVVDKLMANKTGDVTVINSNGDLVEFFKSRPELHLNFDDRGITSTMISRFGKSTQQKNRFTQ
jgi:hypothetical protein